MKKLDNQIANNYLKVRFKQTIPAFIILGLVGLFFILLGGNFKESYTSIQTPLFLKLNKALSTMPDLQWNLTNIGNALIGISLLSPLLYFAPKMWGAMIDSLLISLVMTSVLKHIFTMPRPAPIIGPENFNIIGRILYKNSLPSGHSITLFIFITIIIIAFLPKSKKCYKKVLWVGGLLLGMFFVALSRVACGAHWPLDVLTGSAIGCIFAISGILINNKYPIWDWMTQDKFRPIVLGIAVILLIAMISYIIDHKVIPVYILAVIAIVITIILCLKEIISSRKAQ